MIRFKQLLGLFILLQCGESKSRLRRQGDLNEWKIMTTPKVPGSEQNTNLTRSDRPIDPREHILWLSSQIKP